MKQGQQYSMQNVICSYWVNLIPGVKAGKGTDRGRVVPVQAMNAYEWKRGIALPKFDLGTRRAGSHPAHFTSAEGTPCTHWTGGWVGPRASSSMLLEQKISCPCRESNPGSSIPHLGTLLLHQTLGTSNGSMWVGKNIVCTSTAVYLKPC